MSQVRMAVFVGASCGAAAEEQQRIIAAVFALIDRYAGQARLSYERAVQTALLHVPAFGAASSQSGSLALASWPSDPGLLSLIRLPQGQNPQDLVHVLTVPRSPGGDFDVTLLLGTIDGGEAAIALYTFDVDGTAAGGFDLRYTAFTGVLQPLQWFVSHAPAWQSLTAGLTAPATAEIQVFGSATDMLPPAMGKGLVHPALAVRPLIMPAPSGNKPKPVDDDAIVIRGGIMSAQNFAKDGVDINDRITDASVQSSGQTAVRVSDMAVRQWRGPIPLGNMGATTAKKVRQKGGNVLESPFVGGGGPNHATLFGLTPKDAAQIFTQYSIT